LLLPPPERGRVGEGSKMNPTRIASRSDLPFSRGGKATTSRFWLLR
jgi:hypothetical protein